MKDVLIEKLSPHHDRKSFDCGNDSLNKYIRERAKQDKKRDLSNSYVAITSEDTTTILGYYTLNSYAVEYDRLPSQFSHKLPRYRIPATLIGRLARSLSMKGLGMGEILLTSAINKSIEARDIVASKIIVVEAIDERALKFYKDYDFIPMSNSINERELFLPFESFMQSSGSDGKKAIAGQIEEIANN